MNLSYHLLKQVVWTSSMLANQKYISLVQLNLNLVQNIVSFDWRVDQRVKQKLIQFIQTTGQAVMDPSY